MCKPVTQSHYEGRELCVYTDKLCWEAPVNIQLPAPKRMPGSVLPGDVQHQQPLSACTQRSLLPGHTPQHSLPSHPRGSIHTGWLMSLCRGLPVTPGTSRNKLEPVRSKGKRKGKAIQWLGLHTGLLTEQTAVRGSIRLYMYVNHFSIKYQTDILLLCPFWSGVPNFSSSTAFCFPVHCPLACPYFHLLAPQRRLISVLPPCLTVTRFIHLFLADTSFPPARRIQSQFPLYAPEANSCSLNPSISCLG